MKNFLQDLVSHTHPLLTIVRVTASDDKISIDSLSEDQTVILSATTHKTIPNLVGTFGMPNIHKLDLHLKCPEYRDNANISIISESRGGVQIPTGIHFKNESGDFENDYRFMSREIIDLKLQTVEFAGAKWNVSFTPTQLNIQRFKLQAAAHTEQTLFKVETKDNNLIFSFGDLNTHAGSFVFEQNIAGSLRTPKAFPKTPVMAVLSLDGDKVLKISDSGALQITVDSGIAEYNYIFPAFNI